MERGAQVIALKSIGSPTAQHNFTLECLVTYRTFSVLESSANPDMTSVEPNDKRLDMSHVL